MIDIIIPLPHYGYQDNEDVTKLLTPMEYALQDCITISDWLASADLNYPSLKILGLNFSKLDYLAALLGLYDYFWRQEWTSTQKWNLIKNAFYLWENRGSGAALIKVFEILGLPFTLWTIYGGFILDVSLLNVNSFGEHNPFYAFILLPLSISRVTGWGDYRYVIERFTPITTKVTICYDQFYLDYSVLSEPILS